MEALWTKGPSYIREIQAAFSKSMVQRLGLKLEERKAPMAVLVVDHVEPVPTEN